MVWNSQIRPVKLAILKRNLPRQACERYEEFPPGHVFDSKTASLALCWLGRLGWDLGLRGSPVTANVFLLFWMFCDVLCGLDSARTSNITGMYWGPMAITSGWSAGQPVAWPSYPITGGVFEVLAADGVQIWRQPQLRILVFNPPIEKVVLIEEDQLGKLRQAGKQVAKAWFPGSQPPWIWCFSQAWKSNV